MAKHAVGCLNGNWKGGNKNDLYLDLTKNVKAKPKKPCRFCEDIVEESPMLAGICYDCYQESITLIAGFAETDPEWEVKADQLRDCLDPRTPDQIADDIFADEVSATRARDYPI